MTLEVHMLNNEHCQALKNVENINEKESKSIFEKIDDTIGLTALKEGVKEYSGLNYLSDKITDAVDDGDDNSLSFGEKLWEGVKGAGKAIESFIGSQGLAFMGALWAGSALAGKIGIGKIFNIATKAYFLYQGSKLTYTGTRDFIQADTKDDAKNAAATATTGGIMLYGTIKGLKKDYVDYKTNKAIKAQFETQMNNSKTVLDIPEGEVLTEATLKKAYKRAVLKAHPDKGGSVDSMVEVQQAYDFLSKNLSSAPTTVNVRVEQSPRTTNENSLMLQENNSVAPRVFASEKSLVLSDLDTSKTYVGLKYSNDTSGMIIQKATEGFCIGSESPCHVFALVCEEGNWYIYQSNGHANEVLGTPAGTNKCKAESYITEMQKTGRRVEAYELPMDVETLQTQLGVEYGSGDIKNMAKAIVTNSYGSQSDGSGLTCSEYIASSVNSVCEYFGLPSWCITPAHFKHYFELNKIKAASGRDVSITSYEDFKTMLMDYNSAKEAIDGNGNKVVLYHRNLVNAGKYTYAIFDKDGNLLPENGFGKVSPFKIEETFGISPEAFYKIK